MTHEKRKLDINVGIVRDEAGLLKVGLEVFGSGHGSICLTAQGTRIIAEALYVAAEKLAEMSAAEGQSVP